MVTARIRFGIGIAGHIICHRAGLVKDKNDVCRLCGIHGGYRAGGIGFQLYGVAAVFIIDRGGLMQHQTVRGFTRNRCGRYRGIRRSRRHHKRLLQRFYLSGGGFFSLYKRRHIGIVHCRDRILFLCHFSISLCLRIGHQRGLLRLCQRIEQGLRIGLIVHGLEGGILLRHRQGRKVVVLGMNRQGHKAHGHDQRHQQRQHSFQFHMLSLLYSASGQPAASMTAAPLWAVCTAAAYTSIYATLF